MSASFSLVVAAEKSTKKLARKSLLDEISQLQTAQLDRLPELVRTTEHTETDRAKSLSRATLPSVVAK